MTQLRGPKSRFITTWRFMRNPYTCYRRWQKEFGDTFFVRALNGDVIATCNRENIRRIFALPTEVMSPFALETTRPLVGEASVFLVQGQRHRRERAILSPSFHGSRIDGQAETIREITLGQVQRLEPGRKYRMMDVMLDISLEVIIRVVFGVQTSQRVQLYQEKIKAFVSSFHPALAFSRLLHRRLFGLSPWNRFVRARAEFRGLLLDDIRQRRADKMEGDDLLSRLLDAKYEDGSTISDEAICDHLVTSLLAGHETTQISMSWGMSWLHRHPETLERLRGELAQLNSLDEIIGCGYLNGVCNEALRLNSILADIIRCVDQPLELDDCQLPAKSNIAISICLVHEDPELYPEPFKFRPERWDGLTRKPNEFLPFGGGVRRCLGAPLAILEMKMAIATFVTQCRFSLPNDIPAEEPVYRRNITMAPKTGIPLVYDGVL